MIHFASRTVLTAFTAFALAVSLALPAMAHGDTSNPASDAAAHVTILGDLEISGAFTRATLPGARTGGGFLTITNNGAEDDTLVAASVDFAADAQIHEMAMDGDVMKMRQVDGGIVVPAGESVALAPGGLHMMFMGLNKALVEGETVPVTLTFEKAGSVTLEMKVGSNSADSAGDCAGEQGH